MRMIFGLLAAVAATVFTAPGATATGFGLRGGGYGGYGYPGSAYSAYTSGVGYTYGAGYGSSYGGYYGGYGSSGYGYGSSGYSSYAGYGSSGYSSYAGYGSSGYGSTGGGHADRAHVGPIRRLLARHHARKAVGHGSSGYAGYGSSGYTSVGYGSSGYGYGSSGYTSVGYGSSGYGYGSSGYGSTGYGSTGYSAGYSACGHGAGCDCCGTASPVYYGASAVSGASSAAVAGNVPYPAPPGYRWALRSRVVSPVGDSAVVPSYDAAATTTAVVGAPPYPAPPGYRWVRRARVVRPITPSTATPTFDSSMNESEMSMQLVSSVNAFPQDEIQLTVQVPESAAIFVNGNATTSTGAIRQFVSRGLDPNQEYRFDLRVEAEVNGEKVIDEKSVVLEPGQGEVVRFDFAKPDAAVDTVLTLNVPADAKVVLAGNETKTQGESRVYRTGQLKSGEVWDDYTVSVTSGGVTREKTIRLIAGDDVTLSFDFDAPSSDLIAQR